MGARPAVRVTDACPLALVVADAPDRVAAVLLREKFTVAPDTGLPTLSSRVAVMAEVADVTIEVDAAETAKLPTKVEA